MNQPCWPFATPRLFVPASSSSAPHIYLPAAVPEDSHLLCWLYEEVEAGPIFLMVVCVKSEVLLFGCSDALELFVEEEEKVVHEHPL
jgi:hypothetical protein